MPNKPLAIGIIGASGRLGKAIASLALQDPNLKISAFTHLASRFLHHDLGTLLGLAPLGIPLTADLASSPPDLYLDASLPLSLSQTIHSALKTQKPLVVGSTGLSENDFKLLHDASQQIPLFYAANFSLGMALLHKLTRDAARLLPNADIDLIETHHAQKKDAPSGSALDLAAAIEESHKPPRIHSIRSGRIVGEHELRFNTAEEQIILSHHVHTRDAFARGALAAARFLISQPPGFYTMNNLLTRPPNK